MRIISQQIRDGWPIPVIIPVADSEDEITKKCLDNLRSCTNLPLSVYLVESSGSEFTYGKSMNAGIKAARPADFFIGMDSDAFPRQGAIDALVDYSHQDPRIGYVGVKVFTEENEPNLAWVNRGFIGFAWSCLTAGAPFYALRRLSKGNWYSLPPKGISHLKPGRMTGIVSTMFLLRKHCYDEIGPFDERFQGSWADVDYSYRVLTSDRWFVSSCPTAEVFHKCHITQLITRDPREFEDMNDFIQKWPKERMRAVQRSAREGKFIVHRKERRAKVSPELSGLEEWYSGV